MRVEHPIVPAIARNLFGWMRPFLGTAGSAEERPPPLRELLGREDLERHARDLGAAHAQVRHGGRNRLLPRLADNARFTAEVHAALSVLAAEDGRIPPAGEWLLDNHVLVEEQIRIARRHLPSSYSRQLPLLASGTGAGLPRVYVIAQEFISHVDGRIDSAMLSSFLATYQLQRTLTLGELWGVPIMLRLALVENVRRVAANLLRFVTDHAAAGRWAERLAGEAERAPHQVILIVADLARSGQELSSPFVAELLRRLHGQNSAVAPALSWVESSLVSRGLTTEAVVLRESAQQAADQISIAQSISSLRQLDAVDWDDFVEAQSAVERVLRGDPAAAYAAMAFASRDRYRHVVEDVARRARRPETEVAALAIALAAAADAAGDRQRSHVGAWLVMPPGLARLERDTGASRSWRRLPADLLRHAPLTAYLGLIGMATAGAVLLLARAVPPGSGPWLLIPLGVLAALAASGPAIALVNHLVTRLLPPWPVPRLDFSRGIPPAHRTVVAIPCLLGSAAEVDRLVEQLELHWLANRQPALRFVLLTDLRDADACTMPGDDALVRRAQAGIAAINAEHGPRFLLLHRERTWNGPAGCWMGSERKRGKLAALNRLLVSGDRSAFAASAGDVDDLRGMPYVLVLDADTQLPGGAATELVGAMAHPLNRPVLDRQRAVVVAGHALIQPRVAASLISANRSWYAWLGAGDAGIDPYARAVSNLYQDLFDEGSFVGKGIYDVAVFEAVFAGRLPDNRILSHDLLEGCHLRSAFDSETLLFEDVPAGYLADVARRRRWTRGDWQVARWILPAPPAQAGRLPNPLSPLSRWKLFDNLRRGAAPLAWTVLLGVAVLQPGGTMVAALIGLLLLPYALPLAGAVLSPPGHAGWLAWAHAGVLVAMRSLAEALFTLATLPHEAVWSLDSSLRSMGRLLVGRRQLEWITAADGELAARRDLGGVIGATWTAWFLALVLAAAACAVGAAPAWALVCLPWLAAPAAAWLAGRPRLRNGPVLAPQQRRWLRRLARRTWAWFEVHVGPADNHLPPDNTHERSDDPVAHRTSPTNLGLALLADLAAGDFGWSTPDTVLGRIGATLTGMERLDRHRGHFFNWYDTRDLRVLQPRYVSTVDSGNLVGHLLVLRRGLIELPARPILPSAIADGLRDTAGLVDEALAADPQAAASLRRIGEALDALASGLRWSDALAPLERIRNAAGVLAARQDAGGEAGLWCPALAREAGAWRDLLLRLAPWLALPPPPDRSSAELLVRLETATSIFAVAGLRQEIIPGLGVELGGWRTQLHEAVEAGSREAALLIAEAAGLAARCEDLADADFTFLYDSDRELFLIGYNVSEQRRDVGLYDLLASEARLVSYLAIALGQIPQRHWFRLGRLIADCEGGRALVSWSGSMFEYLMPDLVMPVHPGTLLEATGRAVVRTQISYGRTRGVPWGVSESGYLLIDQHQNFQYRAFGVPGLGLRRGLGDDLVVAPYASALALMIAPVEACLNLERLAAEGRGGRFGLYEAVDYSPDRLPRGQSSATVTQYMVHHQGMSLLAIAQALLGQPMQRRFRADPRLRAADLLLQERVPHLAGAIRLHEGEVAAALRPSAEVAAPLRVLGSPRTPGEVNLLSNGSYQVMVGAGGGGWTRWRGLAVTRWREDPTLEDHGLFCYLRDLDDGSCWSNTYQPTQVEPVEHQAVFTQAKAEYSRVDHGLAVHTEIAVSPEDDVEVRRVVLRNRTSRVRTIEITTYAEVVLAAQAADAGHPAFSNLFVQTELARDGATLLATRRPRTPEESPPWLLHLVNTDSDEAMPPSFETDRAVFLGRGRSLAAPAAMAAPGPLRGGLGPVLDPIVAIRRVLRIPADGQAAIDLVLGVAATRAEAEILAARYRESRFIERVFQLAWTQAQVALRLLSVSEHDAQLYARLAGSVVHPMQHRRAPATVLARNRRGQSGLWAYGISGDLPIVLVRIADPAHLDLVRDAVQAHAWFRAKGLGVDLVVLIEDHTTYRQALQDAVNRLIAAGHEAAQIDRPGGIFVRRGDQMPEDDRVLIQAMARVMLNDGAGTFAEQVERRPRGLPPMPLIGQHAGRAEDPVPPVRRDDLVFRNAHGGFTGDGREYVIVLNAGQSTPAPWVNVLANAHFGTLVSERGSAYSWLENSHEYRLTPWRNDPVGDGSGEAFWIRDEDTGHIWSPTHGAAGGPGGWIVRHGLGYSVFEHREDGISSECWHYVATDAPVKLVSIRLRNHGGRTRRLAVAGYWEWVLGELRERNLMHVVTEIDGRSGALLARNPYHPDFPARIAFVDCSEPLRSCTGDRAEMLGRGGSLEHPRGLLQSRLSDRVGAGFDPCAALLVPVDIPPGEEREIVFVLGVGSDADDVQQLIQRFRGVTGARRALDGVWEHWKRTLGAIRVETPDPAVDVLANGWLPYQILACRMWARTGFYQSGGAFGFRDQLQDAMALVAAVPGLVRAHILQAAARQFREGDVQHWWHPPADRGVRTRISDDYLWLPYAAAHYALTTADTGVFDESVPFIEGRPLNPGEESYYDSPRISGERATLYEHCRRALDRGCGLLGTHALPLIGSGDWNDGMNLVGAHGRGESVWLGQFLIDCLRRFAPIARARGDATSADRWELAATALATAIEAHAWDGGWYLRAWCDDGRPLGSAASAECRIDSLPQSWAVLSGACDPQRARIALAAVDARLVDRSARLIRLFDPPFDHADQEPGYIKGYVPGVRENGGQYTHAAVWVAMAFARIGERARAWELFNLLNPVRHGDSAAAESLYRVEPYVVAADIYGAPPHTGRGGWTWYTGSAGWLYRLLIEDLLGVRRVGDRLRLSPRPPPGWRGYTVHYRHFSTTYRIVVSCADGGERLTSLMIDGIGCDGDAVPLVDDGLEHVVQVGLT